MPSRHPALVVAILAVLGLGLSACSDSDDGAGEPTEFTRAEADEPDGDGGDDGDGQDDGDGSAAGALRDCGLADAVADITGEEVVDAGIRFGTVGRGTDAGDLQLEDEGCGYDLATGDRFVLADLVDGEDATAVESFEALEASGFGAPVANLGDAAVLLDDDKLYVRAGDRIIVVKHDGDVAADQRVLEALAAEALAVDAG
jgi:hypothetical protein